jgi:uncharacterized coiled-coil DUF342 family protein
MSTEYWIQENDRLRRELAKCRAERESAGAQRNRCRKERDELRRELEECRDVLQETLRVWKNNEFPHEEDVEEFESLKVVKKARRLAGEG